MIEKVPVPVIEEVSVTAVIEEVSVPGSWDIESDYYYIKFEVGCIVLLTNFILLFV